MGAEPELELGHTNRRYGYAKQYLDHCAKDKSLSPFLFMKITWDSPPGIQCVEKTMVSNSLWCFQLNYDR